MSHKALSLIKSARAYSLGVFLSRISGMVRDVVLAYFFGTSASIALFMLAYRLSNVFRRVLTETPLSSSFIPIYQRINQKDPKSALYFFRDLTFSLSIVIGVFVIIGAGCGCYYGHLAESLRQESLLFLSSLMFPSLFFLFLYGIFSAFLQAHHVYFLTSVAPIVFNLCWILPSICMGYFGHLNLKILSLAVVVGFGMQFLVLLTKTIPILSKTITYKEWIRPNFFTSELKEFMKPFFLASFGVATTQINAALDGFFAKAASSSGPAFLWYAIRIEQVPIALFAVSLATSVLPHLSKSRKEGNFSSLQEIFHEGQKQMVAWMVFSMFGLLACGALGLNLVFGRGAFTLESLHGTFYSLLAYSLGVVPQGLCMLYTSSIYAFESFTTPAKISIYMVLFHLVCNGCFVFLADFGPVSVALSTTLSSFLQLYFLKQHLLQQGIQSESIGLMVKYLLIGSISAFFAFIANLKAYFQLFVIKEMLSFRDATQAFIIGGGIFIVLFILLEKAFGLDAIYKNVRIRLSK